MRLDIALRNFSVNRKMIGYAGTRDSNIVILTIKMCFYPYNMDWMTITVTQI